VRPEAHRHLLQYRAIRILARDMQIQSYDIRPIGRHGQVIQARGIAEERIVGILQRAGAIDSEIDYPLVIGPEFERPACYHHRRYLPYLVGCIIGHLRIRIPAPRRRISDDTPGGCSRRPGIVVEIRRQFIIPAVWNGQPGSGSIRAERSVAPVAIVDMIPVRRVGIFEILDTTACDIVIALV
jgi:hypothetical protein